MKLVPITNDGPNTKYVGSIAIPPGETRLVEEQLVPGYSHASAKVVAAAAVVVDPVLELLDKPVKDIVGMVTGREPLGVPMISDEQLTKLEAAESNGKTRKTVIGAIAAEKLRRANELAELNKGAAEMDAFADSLQKMDEAELLSQIDLAKDNPTMKAAIEAEMERRQGGAQLDSDKG